MNTNDGIKDSAPFFSIIVPVYKVSKAYFTECIDSILNQYFKDLELILIDDGSPDDCGKWCDMYASIDNRVRVLHQCNQGVSAARNNGIKMAKADWIMFVDSDDWVGDGIYQYLHDRLFECQYDIFMFSAEKVYEKKRCVLDYGLQSGTTYDTNKIETKEFLYRLVMKPPQKHHNVAYYSVDKVFRREFLMKNKLRYPENIQKSEDKVFILKCLTKLEKLHYEDIVFYYYRINSSSACNKYNESTDKDRIQLAEILLQIAEEMDNEIRAIKGNSLYAKLSEDCTRFLFGIISDVLTLKFYHNYSPLSRKTRKVNAYNFLSQSTIRSVLTSVQYNQLSWFAKVKKFLLQNGNVEAFCFLYQVNKFMSGAKPQ